MQSSIWLVVCSNSATASVICSASLKGRTKLSDGGSQLTLERTSIFQFYVYLYLVQMLQDAAVMRYMHPQSPQKDNNNVQED